MNLSSESIVKVNKKNDQMSFNRSSEHNGILESIATLGLQSLGQNKMVRPTSFFHEYGAEYGQLTPVSPPNNKPQMPPARPAPKPPHKPPPTTAPFPTARRFPVKRRKKS